MPFEMEPATIKKEIAPSPFSHCYKCYRRLLGMPAASQGPGPEGVATTIRSTGFVHGLGGVGDRAPVILKIALSIERNRGRVKCGGAGGRAAEKFGDDVFYRVRPDPVAAG
jgi:hypothetical protein